MNGLEKLDQPSCIAMCSNGGRVWGKWSKFLHSSNFLAPNYNSKEIFFSLLPKHISNSNLHCPNVFSKPIRNQFWYHHGRTYLWSQNQWNYPFRWKYCFFTDFYAVLDLNHSIFSLNLYVLQNPDKPNYR